MISHGFKCSDLNNFEKVYNLPINIFELNFYQEQNKWKHKLIPIEISKKESDRFVDFLIYKTHYVLFKKLNVFLGEQACRYICKRCLNSYTSKNMIIKHKQQCLLKEITSIKTSPKSHLNWKNLFNRNPLYFRMYAGFEADNENDNSSIGNKTSNVCKQNPVYNGFRLDM